jgi:hypothetical protein
VVAIDSVENGYGDTCLRQGPSIVDEAWKTLESGEFVTGQTSGKVKGGLTVLVNGIRAFLPGSLIDTSGLISRTRTRPWNSRSSARPQTQQRLCCHAEPWSKLHGRRTPKLMETLKRRLLSGASLRTSPDTVRSSLTWAAIDGCCTSPTWHGAAYVTERSGDSWTGNRA